MGSREPVRWNDEGVGAGFKPARAALSIDIAFPGCWTATSGRKELTNA